MTYDKQKDMDDLHNYCTTEEFEVCYLELTNVVLIFFFLKQGSNFERGKQ